MWSDSRGRIWVSYWNTGQVGMYDPAAQGVARVEAARATPHAYSVWVDDRDKVWLTDWSINAIVRFDPGDREVRELSVRIAPGANVRQMLGRAGEAWGAESGTDRLVMVPSQ